MNQSSPIRILLLIIMAINRSAALQSSPSKGMIFHWFRGTDLRLHDNPALDRAIEQCAKTNSKLVPVFCFDPRIFGDSARSDFGSLKCGPRRAKFVMESIADLRQSFESKGSKLLVAYARPEDFFGKLLKETKLSKAKAFYQDEVCSEERAVEFKVKKLFDTTQAVWGSTLYDLADLPYENGVYDMPDAFTPFRNKVEKNCKIGRPLPVPKQLHFPDMNEFPCLEQYASFMPSMGDLGYTKEQIASVATVDQRGVMDFKGGETAALARVKDYIWDKDLLKVYFDTRNGMIGADYSTKFAPWLAHGNLSPRYVARECKKYEEERVENKSTYWVVFELLWRDFFKLFALKHGTSMFSPGGTIGSDQEWKHYDKNLKAWIEGRTGFPLVDANMRELAATGFMSNRGRQNVCSFLVLELNQDWRYGADYFESTLLDYDVHSNWGNWCSGAGMTGGRLNRFNIVKQSKDYDQHGEYVRHWVPELKDVPNQLVHEPWKMTQFQQVEYNCRLGVNYPNPISKPFYFDPKSGGRSKGDNRGRGKGGSNSNRNRGRGQRKDMKSLATGNIRMD
jgi:deoxyribodipyrimidine photo-lyase